MTRKEHEEATGHVTTQTLAPAGWICNEYQCDEGKMHVDGDDDA